MHQQTHLPCCHCGKVVDFLDFRRGYRECCSRKCTATSKKVSSKKKNTIQKKYGVEHYSKSDQYKTKFKKTMIEKYGVENPGQIETKKTDRARTKQLTFYNNLFSENKTYEPAFSFDEYTHVRDKQLLWKCRLCDQTFSSWIFGIEPSCTSCFPKGNNGGPSSIEFEVREFIDSIYTGNVILNSRSVIPPKEIDIYIPEFSLGIEINGTYWHSDKFLNPTYHQDKVQQMLEKNISCLMISDYDWMTKQRVVKNMIRYRLGHYLTIPTRKCIIQRISPKIAKQFHTEYHLGGFSAATYHLGAYFNDQLVAVCSIAQSNRFTKSDAESELVRYSLKHSVPGVIGKFISYIKKHIPDIKTIISYADLRYGNGTVYKHNGFECVSITAPGYWYFVNGQEYHRLSWSKKRLVEMGYDKNKTEKQIMDEDVASNRVYDAGNVKYKLEIK